MSRDPTCPPSWGAADSFVVQATDPGRVAGGAEGSSCRMEDGDLDNVVCRWTEREGGGSSSSESQVLFVEEEVPNEIIKVYLTDVFSKCLE